MNWIIPFAANMSLALLVISCFLFQNIDLTFADGNDLKNSSTELEEKLVLHFIDVDVMPKSKRETKKPNYIPYYQKGNGTTRVFRRSKIRKKLPRRFAKYRHSTRVIRGMPAIVLLPPFYRRPVIQNFTVRPPAMMEHPDPVPVAPIEMPTPQPEPLVSSPRIYSSDAPSSYSYTAQSPTQPFTTQYFTEVTTSSYDFTPTTPSPSTEFEPQIEWNEDVHMHSVELHTPPDNENGFTISSYNSTDVMYDQPPASIVQYLLPPLWPNYDEGPAETSNQLKNDFEHDVNIKDPNEEFTLPDSESFVTTQATTVDTDPPYSDLEVLKPPVYSDSYFWTDYQNQSVYDVEVNNALTSSGDYNSGYTNSSKSASYVDVNLSLLSSDVASMGMKVEATAKAIEMARDVMRNQAVVTSTAVTQQRREDTESPLAVAESGYFGLQNGKYTQSSETTTKKAQKKKPYKRPSDEVIPGVAGQDYPVYASPPLQARNIPCKEGFGYIPDPSTRCQVFYVCTGPGMGEPMLCPNGTLFSKDFLVCDWWYNVECAPN